MVTVYRLFMSELRRNFIQMWSYRYDTLGEIAIWIVAFPLMIIIFASVAGGYDAERQLASLVGFLIWHLCMGVLSATTQEVAREANEGTLEPVLLSPLSPLSLFSLRVVAAYVVQGVQTLLLGLILILFLRLPVRITGPALLLFGLTVLGVYGVCLALGGLAMVHKQVASLIGIISLLALLATGALIPLDGLPYLFPVLQISLPTAWGIHMLREAILGKAANPALWSDTAGLALQSTFFVGLGLLLFNWGFREAQRSGSLGSY